MLFKFLKEFIIEKNIVLKMVKTGMTEEEYQNALVRKTED
jgi:hypothetical protein